MYSSRSMPGMKHKKAAKLYKELGKEIPPPEITGDTEPKPEVPIVGRELIETKSDATKSSKVKTRYFTSLFCGIAYLGSLGDLH